MKTCSRCHVEKPLGEFWKRPSASDGRMSHCSKCAGTLNASYRKENPEKLAALKAEWWKKNKEKVYEANRRWSRNNPEKHEIRRKRWEKANPLAYAAAQAKAFSRWQKKNLDYFAAHNRARDAAKLRAVPSWASKDAIACVYADAARMRRETGQPYEVDHIVPLQSKIVSGLHWEGNLQILLKAENISKHNRRWPDMPI